jgi:Acetyltransferase (GNAT) domain
MTRAPTLITERLSIEPMSLAHWEAYASAWADPRMTEFIGGDPRNRNLSWGKMLQGIGLWSLFGYGYWSFVERASGKFVGNGGLAQFERGIPELEGYPEAGWAFAADAWGKGYAASSTPGTPPRTMLRPSLDLRSSPNRMTLSASCSFTAASRSNLRDKLCITPSAGLPLRFCAAKRLICPAPSALRPLSSPPISLGWAKKCVQSMKQAVTGSMLM